MKTSTAPLPLLRSVKVLDQLRERIRYLHYSLRTEQAYVHWVRAFIRFHGVRHPATLGSSEVEAFLSWLANERKVSVSTHRQALAALLFFYGKVLCTDLPWLQEIGRPRPSRRLPVVLTPDEVVRILGFQIGDSLEYNICHCRTETVVPHSEGVPPNANHHYTMARPGRPTPVA